MTDDELRRLIAGEFHPSWLRSEDILELARDALRFRHIIQNADFNFVDPKSELFPDCGYWLVEWASDTLDARNDLREAIDADMEAPR